MLQGRVVVHSRAGEDGEEPRREPEHLVDRPLGALGVMLHQDFKRRAALLRMPGLVGLGRGDHVGKADVARVERVGCQSYELEIGKASLKGERQLDGDIDRIRSEHHPIEERPGRDDAPLVGVVGLERPVELWVPGDELVG